MEETTIVLQHGLTADQQAVMQEVLDHIRIHVAAQARADALEEAARLADDETSFQQGIRDRLEKREQHSAAALATSGVHVCEKIAAAIRALKEAPASTEPAG